MKPEAKQRIDAIRKNTAYTGVRKTIVIIRNLVSILLFLPALFFGTGIILVGQKFGFTTGGQFGALLITGIFVAGIVATQVISHLILMGIDSADANLQGRGGRDE